MRVDTFTYIDMRSVLVMRLFTRTKEFAVEFCERCSRVCDAGCRRVGLREEAFLKAWRFGVRV
jgi:hypothetical protein